jgi:hypothetical protein
MTPRKPADGNTMVGGAPASNDPNWIRTHVPRATWEVDEQPIAQPEKGDDGD